MIHIDLFSGIGGFAYAFEEVFGDEGKTALFCDNDPYCQGVLRKHWPEVPIWGDIRELIAHAKRQGWNSDREMGGERRGLPDKGCLAKEAPKREGWNSKPSIRSATLLTGGFPCQPFSHAGKRRGKGDNRYLWPEMLECVRLFKPRWVIAENVYGLLSLEGGVVFEQVCLDLEEEGYEVRAFIIPACAVNAPHRRDRVWIVGHSTRNPIRKVGEFQKRQSSESRGSDSNAPNTQGERLERRNNRREREQEKSSGLFPSRPDFDVRNWQSDWREVAAATCVRGVDDGSSKELYGVSEAKHRTERLKMLGNGIVPQVAMEIMRAIKEAEKSNNPA